MLADTDVWIQVEVREDAFKYYAMLFVYVGDILAVSHKATDVIKGITAFYRAKEGSIKLPDIYLGANRMKVKMLDGREFWGSSLRDFVKNAVITVEGLFEEDGEGYLLDNTVKSPFPSGYKPEIDVKEELGPDLASRYLQLIGIFRWAVEIGQVGIFLEVSLFSQYQAGPRLVHLEVLYNVCDYLKNHKGMGKLAYDLKTPEVDELAFNNNADWKDFYGDVEEELPPKMPDPCGNVVWISAFVDANHAGNVVTR